MIKFEGTEACQGCGVIFCDDKVCDRCVWDLNNGYKRPHISTNVSELTVESTLPICWYCHRVTTPQDPNKMCCQWCANHKKEGSKLEDDS